MLSIEPIMVIVFGAHTPMSRKRMFLVSFLGALPNHIPLKYRCPNKKSNQIRGVYLMECNMVDVKDHDQKLGDQTPIDLEICLCCIR